jgi:hypothetical protein
MISILTSAQLNLDPALAASLGSIAVLVLIALLMLKELASTAEGEWQAFGRFLNVAILPLLVAFCITVALRVVDVLNSH